MKWTRRGFLSALASLLSLPLLGRWGWGQSQGNGKKKGHNKMPNGLLNNLKKSWSPISGVWQERTGAGPNGILTGSPPVVDVAVAGGKAFSITALSNQFIKMVRDSDMALTGSWQWSLVFSIPNYIQSAEFENFPFYFGSNNPATDGFYDFILNSDHKFCIVVFLSDGSSIDAGDTKINQVVSLDVFHVVSWWWKDDEKLLYGKIDNSPLFTSTVQTLSLRNSTDDWWLGSGNDGTGYMDGDLVSLNWWKAANGDDLPGESGHDALYASGVILDYSSFDDGSGGGTERVVSLTSQRRHG